jgi:hypothetical protein
LHPLLRPALLSTLQERLDQIVLRREVAIQRGLRHPCLLDELIDAHVSDPALREELVRRIQETLLRLGPDLARLDLRSHARTVALTERSV